MNHLHKRKSLYFLQHSGPGQNENCSSPNIFDPLGIIENTSTKKNSSQENRRYMVTESTPNNIFYVLSNL